MPFGFGIDLLVFRALNLVELMFAATLTAAMVIGAGTGSTTASLRD